MKKNLLKKSGLYLVTDRCALQGKDIISIVSLSLEAGVDMVQFRDKEATDREFLETGKKIKGLTKRKKALFIVNNRVDMALALDSDGVHLGQDDMDVETARRILGKRKTIGLSTHSLLQIHEAAERDLDYISVGPVFTTPTKPDYTAVGLELVSKAAKESRIPLVAIGGINESNIRDVLAAGAKRIAVVRAILSAEDPFMATRDLIGKIL